MDTMSLLVVGSVAYDSITTTADSRTDALGGSAVYFAISSSYFSPVSLVAVVGYDFKELDRRLLESHSVDISGLEHNPGKTFRWAGSYKLEEPDSRETLDTQLNVFGNFSPKLSSIHSRSLFLFLANIDPELQIDVLNKMTSRPALVSLDTMNYWIESKKEKLITVIKAVDLLFIDETEIKSLSGEHNIAKAVRVVMNWGPSTVLVKRGEHGALLFSENSTFAVPAFPLDVVVDPTGAGDSFAGGFMGYIAKARDLSPATFRRASVVGAVMGSFAVESFSVDRLHLLSPRQISDRLKSITDMALFEPIQDHELFPGHTEQ